MCMLASIVTRCILFTAVTLSHESLSLTAAASSSAVAAIHTFAAVLLCVYYTIEKLHYTKKQWNKKEKKKRKRCYLAFCLDKVKGWIESLDTKSREEACYCPSSSFPRVYFAMLLLILELPTSALALSERYLCASMYDTIDSIASCIASSPSLSLTPTHMFTAAEGTKKHHSLSASSVCVTLYTLLFVSLAISLPYIIVINVYPFPSSSVSTSPSLIHYLQHFLSLSLCEVKHLHFSLSSMSLALSRESEILFSFLLCVCTLSCCVLRSIKMLLMTSVTHACALCCVWCTERWYLFPLKYEKSWRERERQSLVIYSQSSASDKVYCETGCEKSMKIVRRSQWNINAVDLFTNSNNVNISCVGKRQLLTWHRHTPLCHERLRENVASPLCMHVHSSGS